MKILSPVFAVCLLAGLAGCSATVSDTPVEVEQKEAPIKGVLESVAQSGELGSRAMEIRSAFETMKAGGDAKADELLKDLDDLERTSNPNQIKSKAAAMAAKL